MKLNNTIRQKLSNQQQQHQQIPVCVSFKQHLYQIIEHLMCEFRVVNHRMPALRNSNNWRIDQMLLLKVSCMSCYLRSIDILFSVRCRAGTDRRCLLIIVGN
jgi:hypothetical protein